MLLLWNFNLSLFLSRCVSLSLSLFLSPFIAFVVDIILTVIVEYCWDLHCLAVVCCFCYLQLCLFYFCLSGTTLLTVFLLAIALFVCIMCHYCLSGTTILTFDKPWNLCVGICTDCLYCVLLFKKWLGPCDPFVGIICFFICLLA